MFASVYNVKQFRNAHYSLRFIYFPFNSLCKIFTSFFLNHYQFYSNSDLMKFMALSGLPNATIPVQNVFGDLPNNQTEPGGEAQLDVEYIMVGV